MARTRKIDPAEHIVPIVMNGLRGRMLRIPAAKMGQRDILFVYGTHSSLEQHFEYITALSRYGAVTAPDLPGMGGMQSFFSIGIRPTLDAFADYLAAFIKLRYKRRRFRVVAYSYGFAIVTRMLQRFPELARRVDLVVCVDGYVHKEDFMLTRSTLMAQRLGAVLLSQRQPAWIAQRIAQRSRMLRLAYRMVTRKPKAPHNYDFEIHMWRQNDIRTYMYTIRSRLGLNLCSDQVALPVCYVANNRRDVDPSVVEQHLAVVYESVARVASTKKDRAGQLPQKLHKILQKKQLP